MVNLLLAPERDLAKSHVVKTIYDPVCGTGGMLSVAEEYIRHLNRDAQPKLFGQDFNDESWAVCKSDMLIKGEDADNIILGDTFTKDGFARDADGNKWTFDYMLANPPFGVEWKQQQKDIQKEADSLRYDGRFGAGTPRINDGALLFLQHMISKMRSVKAGGSRIWVLTNRKEKRRKGKVQLIDTRNDKPEDPDHIAEITRIYEKFSDGETRAFNIDGKQKALVVSKVFGNEDFGYHKITVERPLRDEQGNAVVAAKGKNKGKPEPDPGLRDTETVPLKDRAGDIRLTGIPVSRLQPPSGSRPPKSALSARTPSTKPSGRHVRPRLWSRTRNLGTQASNDKEQGAPMPAKAQANPEGLNRPGTWLADTGYYSEKNIEACVAAEVEPLIAVKREEHLRAGGNVSPNPRRWPKTPPLGDGLPSVSAAWHRECPERMDAGMPRVEFETHGRITSAIGKSRGNRAFFTENRPHLAKSGSLLPGLRCKSDRLLEME